MMRRRRGRLLASAALMILVCLQSLWAAQGLSIGVGVDYSTGKYGEASTTEILFVPVIFKWESDPWLVKLSVPYVTIRGPGQVVLNGDKPLVSGSTAGVRTTEEGLGDVMLAVGRTLWESADYQSGLDLTAKIKIPTADEKKGLGTGKVDYALMLDGYTAIAGITLFSGAGYRWLGDPTGVNYRNVWSANVGLSVKAAEKVSLGVSYDFRQAAVSGSPYGSELTPFVSIKLPRKFKVQIYGNVGLSDGSADYGGGMVLQKNFQ